MQISDNEYEYSENCNTQSKQLLLLKQSKSIKKKLSGVGFSKSPKLVAQVALGVTDFPDDYMMSQS